MSIDNFIIRTYCLIEQKTKKIESFLNGFRKRGFEPKLTDAEVITMEIVGEFLGYDTDVGIWRYFQQHWKTWFPSIGSRSAFAKQASNLWKIKQILQQELSEMLGGFSDELHMADGFPIPICKFKRAGWSRSFRGEASYGYCASKAETYYPKFPDLNQARALHLIT